MAGAKGKDAGKKNTGESHPVVLIRKKHDSLALPDYESSGAAGMDLRAFVDNEINIPPMGRARIPTGLFIEVPDGYEAQVRPRSGLAFNNGVTVLNSPGTIDSDYRGEVGVILINLGGDSFTVRNGERIAQMVISPVIRAKVTEAENLSVTMRDSGGFGSTGI
jgi:dUTP pyrophosphatase